MCRNGGSLALSSILLKFFPIPNTSMHGLVLASSQPLWPLDFRVLSQRKLVGRVKTVLYDQASIFLVVLYYLWPCIKDHCSTSEGPYRHYTVFWNNSSCFPATPCSLGRDSSQGQFLSYSDAYVSGFFDRFTINNHNLKVPFLDSTESMCRCYCYCLSEN